MMVLGAAMETVGIVALGQHVVQELAYIAQTTEVLTGGSLGLRAFHLGGWSNANGLHRRWILEPSRIFPCAPWVSNLRYRAHTNTAAIAWSQTGCVDLFDTRRGRKIARLSARLHERPMTDALYFARSFYFITSCTAGMIKVWYKEHTFSREATKEEERVHKEAVVLAAPTQERDGELVLCHLHTFRGHRRSVTSLAAHPTFPALIISASLDSSLRLWDVETLTSVRVVEPYQSCPLTSLTIAAESNLIVATASDGTVLGFSLKIFERPELEPDEPSERPSSSSSSSSGSSVGSDVSNLQPARRPRTVSTKVSTHCESESDDSEGCAQLLDSLQTTQVAVRCDASLELSLPPLANPHTERDAPVSRRQMTRWPPRQDTAVPPVPPARRRRTRTQRRVSARLALETDTAAPESALVSMRKALDAARERRDVAAGVAAAVALETNPGLIAYDLAESFVGTVVAAAVRSIARRWSTAPLNAAGDNDDAQPVRHARPRVAFLDDPTPSAVVRPPRRSQPLARAQPNLRLQHSAPPRQLARTAVRPAPSGARKFMQQAHCRRQMWRTAPLIDGRPS